MTRRVGTNSTADDVLGGLDLSGKTYFVTGATAGVGLETAAALAGHGGRVFIGVRNAERGARACSEIRGRHPGASIEAVALELASLASIRECASALPVDALDVLICNAGVYGGGYHTTEDGFEHTVGVCHIGHFALFQGLRERLEASGAARVVVVSSESHRTPPRLNLEALPHGRDGHLDLVAYGRAKLCNLLFARELDRRYSERGIRGNALHPGTLVASSIGRDSVLARLAVGIARPFTKTLAQAAATSVWVATAPELADVGGKYFRNCKERRSSPEAERADLAHELWEQSTTWIEAALPRTP